MQHAIPDDVPEVTFAASDGVVHLPALIAAGVRRLDARRRAALLAQGGVKLDGEALRADALDCRPSAIDGRVLQLGKRRFARILIA